MRSDQLLSVIIPVRNGCATLGEQLNALFDGGAEVGFEVVVVDNGSTDGTCLLVEEWAARESRLRYLSAPERIGPSYARNRGAEVAAGSLLAFCDADDVVGSDWVRTMATELRDHPLVTGPQDVQMLNPEWVRDAFGKSAGRDRQMFLGIFPFGPTASLGIHRKVFESLGGFDESLATGEDIDLCMQAWLHGYELAFCTGALVNYRLRSSMGELWHQGRTYAASVPLLAKRLRVAGTAVPKRLRGLRNWVWLLRRLPSLRSRADRARWIVVAAQVVGRLHGSVRARFLLL